MRGFVDMDAAPTEGSNNLLRLQSGAASSVEGMLAMRPAWRMLGERSELPTAQFEWAASAAKQLGQNVRATVAFVSDGECVRALLPMLVRHRRGVEELEYMMPPGIPMPVDILHTDPLALQMLLKFVLRLGRPIRIEGLLASSPAVDGFRQLAAARRCMLSVEPTPNIPFFHLRQFTLQDRSQSAARVSILATSYGLSGGPNDVIFQFVSPSLEQVMTLFHESMQFHRNGNVVDKQGLDTMEFMKAHALHCAHRGEIRFSCLRLAGRLLGVQMIQVRKGAAWLLAMALLERFRSTTLESLLMGETIRKLQQEGIDRLILPPTSNLREVGEPKLIPCVNLVIHPWSLRSMWSRSLNQVVGISSRIVRRRRRDASDI